MPDDAMTRSELLDHLAAALPAGLDAVTISEATTGGARPRSALLVWDRTSRTCTTCGGEYEPPAPRSIQRGELVAWPREHACGTITPDPLLATAWLDDIRSAADIEAVIARVRS